jgi:hypothetical protein
MLWEILAVRFVDSGQWTVDSGQWTVDSGQWTVDSGQWTVDSGQWTVNFWRCKVKKLIGVQKSKCKNRD